MKEKKKNLGFILPVLKLEAWLGPKAQGNIILLVVVSSSSTKSIDLELARKEMANYQAMRGWLRNPCA